MRQRSLLDIRILCAALLLLSACAARSDVAGTRNSGSRDLITAAELSEVDAIEAYTAIQRLRPLWLRPRGATSLRESGGALPVVYVDNIPFGDINTLQNILIPEIAEIRYVSGPDATTRWGTGLVGGVIEVIRKRQRE